MAYRVFAVAAHPDDIEFCMAGTLILLSRTGCEIHYMNIADGCCGSAEYDAETIAKIRLAEAQNAAGHINAVFHPPLTADLEIFYNRELLAKMGSVMRDVAPDILLVPSPQDYMEDHVNAGRLAVAAAFCRAIRNLRTEPPREPFYKPVAVYHAQPYGNRDLLNRMVTPDFYVNIGNVIDSKAFMLAEHKSQKDWLDKSQGVDSYIDNMRVMAREIGELSGRYSFAEGWRRHNTLGLCGADDDFLFDMLGEYIS